jgi:ActR/RegA family two-component response regulator
MKDTILIVDDEESVRRTFQDWLRDSTRPVEVFVAADAESALLIANERTIDLAILDWNLGTGSDGLQLLEDLVEFQPEIIAILVTGFASQATPLAALRMGVRDYLDKNQDLTRETFLTAVTRQLTRIAPVKRQRELNRGLAEFREAVQKILPIVRGAAAFQDPVPLPSAIHALFRFLIRSTGARDGALIVRHLTPQGEDRVACYDREGQKLETPALPFPRTLAASVATSQEPSLIADFQGVSLGAVELYPFEQNRHSLLATVLPVASGSHVVLELFDKPNFTADDRNLVAATSEIGAELLRQAFSERHTHRMLIDAVESALQTTGELEQSINSSPTSAMLDRLKAGMLEEGPSLAEPDTSLKLIEAARRLAQKHGTPAVEHCLRIMESVEQFLHQVEGG